MSRGPDVARFGREPAGALGRFSVETGDALRHKELDMRKALMLGAAALALAVAAPSFAQDRTAPGTPGTTRPGTTQTDKRADQAAQERMARLKAAQPAAKLALSGEALIGAEVRNTQDQKIGSVKDIILADGKITAIVVGRGGVLGMGTDYHQVEWSQAKMTDDIKTVVLDLSEDQVKALPKLAYEKGKWGPAPVMEKKASPPASTAPSAPPSRGTDTAPKNDMPAKKDEGPAPTPKNQ
jgi:hypothetical protein